MIKVIVVDDQRLFRESIKYMIEQDTEIEVVGVAENGLKAYELCETLSPDVILMDIMMPVCDGIEGTKLIKSKYEKIQVIMLTSFTDYENISRVLLNGADGYVLKDVKPEELILAIKCVSHGFDIIQKNVYKVVLKKLNALNDEVSFESLEETPDFDLTEKEIEVIKLIVDGCNNKKIAATLFITEGRVKNIISGILTKLNLNDRTQLAVYAIKSKLISLI